MHIHAWLEEREIPGLHRAFRGQLSSSSRAGVVGVSSLNTLHRAIDDTLRDAGVIEGDTTADADHHDKDPTDGDERR